jgi:hypothetical protein
VFGRKREPVSERAGFKCGQKSGATVTGDEYDFPFVAVLQREKL